jgi:hypothetical protein
LGMGFPGAKAELEIASVIGASCCGVGVIVSVLQAARMERRRSSTKQSSPRGDHR